MDDASHLPDELNACHSLLVEQARTLVELQQSREQLSNEVEELKLTVQKLLLRLNGHRPERVVDDPNQLKIDFGKDDPAMQDALADAAADAEKIVQEFTVRREIKKKKPRGDQKFPAHLPREEIIANVSDEQKNCPEHGPRELIGYDTTETLEFTPPVLHVRVMKYPKYACPAQPQCGIAQPERPTGLVEGDRFGTSVAAEIITAKYGYHLPFYRQQDWFAGSGWMPSRSTLLNILSAAEFVLRPLAKHYREAALAGERIGCDETGVTLIMPPNMPDLDPADRRSGRIKEVLQEAQKNGRSSVKARMWAYRSFDVPYNVFDFTVSRHRDGPDEILKKYQGKLMADCWSGFQKIDLRTNARIVRAACWAHARRKVFEGRSSYPQAAAVLLALIRQLYDIEDRGKLLNADKRRELRERESRPVLDHIRAYIQSETMAQVLPKSNFAEAIGYLHNHWDALNVYVTDGGLPIDNNEVEQLMKQVAIGRKNWLFIGSLEAGTRAATLLTIVSTAVRNDLNVWAYLKDVLAQLLGGSTDYAALRADVWKNSHPEAVRSYRAEERRDQADRQRYQRASRRLRDRSRQKSK